MSVFMLIPMDGGYGVSLSGSHDVRHRRRCSLGERCSDCILKALPHHFVRGQYRPRKKRRKNLVIISKEQISQILNDKDTLYHVNLTHKLTSGQQLLSYLSGML